MVEEVSENVNCYRKVRALGLSDGAIKDHSVLAFNPDMYQSERKIRYANGDHKNSRKPKEDQQHSGKDLETPNQIKWPIPEDVKRPKDDEDLAYMTVRVEIKDLKCASTFSGVLLLITVMMKFENRIYILLTARIMQLAC